MAFSSLTMNAVTVVYPRDVTINVVTAGTLINSGNMLKDQIARHSILHLTITGNINVNDIYSLYAYFDAVQTIDLSNANIIGVTNDKNYKDYPNDCYPNAFFGLSQYDITLTKIIIPKSTKSIQNNAFNFTSSILSKEGSPLTDFTIPSNVTSLGAGIFQYKYNPYFTCTLRNLRSEILNPQLVKCDSYTSPFLGIDYYGCTLHVPYGTKAIYENTEYWNAFQNIVEDAQIITTNINTIEATSKISIYPNPCTNSLHIIAVGAVEIINMSGAVVKMVDVLENESVDVSDLSKGVYFVRVGQSVSKLVKE